MKLSKIKWLQVMAIGEMLLYLLVDLIKAFRTINYEILLKKLRLFRSLDQSMQWFRLYLSEYTHIVNIYTKTLCDAVHTRWLNTSKRVNKCINDITFKLVNNACPY